MTDNISALVFTAESSLADLRQHLRNLDTAPPKAVETLLKQVKEVAEVLSMSLDRLSHYTDMLEPANEGAEPPEPEHDAGFLEAALLVSEAIEHGLCRHCGGIQHLGNGNVA